MNYPYYLMAPGPVQIPDDVLTELARPMIHHRTPEFDVILADALVLLKKFFQTEQPVFIQTATGSGGMESAIVNTLSPGDTVIAVVSGKFGERWRDIALAYGINVLSIDVPWGQAVDPKQVEKLLKKHSEVRAVLTQACETSTAVLHPINALANLVRNYPQTLLMVDAITSIGVTAMPMDDWGIDVIVAGSQKAFMLPTGLTFISFSKKAWPFVEAAKCPRHYWDVRAENKSNLKGETHFSSSVSMIRGLRVALQMMLKEGLNNQIKRVGALAHATRIGGEALGLSVYSQAPSPSVTALLVPPGIDGQKVRAHLETKYNCTIAGGQDYLKGKIIRIGHLGHIGRKETIETIERLGLTLKDLGHECDIIKAIAVTAKAYDECV